MKIESKFTTGIALRFIRRAVRKKLGYDVNVQLNSFRTSLRF